MAANLPTDLLLLCCRFLNHTDLAAFAVSSRQFSRLMSTPQAWIGSIFRFRCVPEGLLAKLSPVLARIAELDLTDCSRVSTDDLCSLQTQLAKHASLRFLRLERCDQADISLLASLIEVSPRLVELHLRRCLAASRFANELIPPILKCGQLRALSLVSCGGLQDQHFAAVAKAAPAMTSLNLSWSDHVSDTGLLKIIQHGQLTALDLTSCHQVTDATLAAVGKHCHGMRELLLRSCKSLSDRGLASIGRGCPGLVSINLNCVPVTDRGILDLVDNAGIRTVGLDNDRDIELIGADPLSAAEHKRATQQCSALEYINLRGCTVTDVGVLAVAICCPRLAVANLSFTLVGPRSVAALGSSKADTSTSDPPGPSSSMGCPLLTELKLTGLELDDASVSDLAAGCPRLTNLDLDCAKVSDSAVTSLSQHCPALTRLDLSFCPVSDEGVVKLAQGCRQLGHLLVRGCPRVTVTSLQALYHTLPDIIIDR